WKPQDAAQPRMLQADTACSLINRRTCGSGVQVRCDSLWSFTPGLTKFSRVLTSDRKFFWQQAWRGNQWLREYENRTELCRYLVKLFICASCSKAVTPHLACCLTRSLCRVWQGQLVPAAQRPARHVWSAKIVVVPGPEILALP